MIWPFKRWVYLGYTICVSPDGGCRAYKLYRKGKKRKIAIKYRVAFSNKYSETNILNTAALLSWLAGGDAFPHLFGR